MNADNEYQAGLLQQTAQVSDCARCLGAQHNSVWGVLHRLVIFWRTLPQGKAIEGRRGSGIPNSLALTH